MAARLWPGRGASASEWLAFHQRRADLFACAARTDPSHQHEARFLASVEREEADAAAARIATTGDNKTVGDARTGAKGGGHW